MEWLDVCVFHMSVLSHTDALGKSSDMPTPLQEQMRKKSGSSNTPGRAQEAADLGLHFPAGPRASKLGQLQTTL